MQIGGRDASRDIFGTSSLTKEEMDGSKGRNGRLLKRAVHQVADRETSSTQRVFALLKIDTDLRNNNNELHSSWIKE